MIDSIRSPLTLLLLAFITLQATAQTNAVIKGKVTDAETLDGLPGVSISIKGTVQGTISDQSGTFVIPSKVSAPFTLVASLIGYKTQELVIANDNLPIAILLAPQVLLAEEVVVTASRVEESVMKSPVAIEKLDGRAIKQSAAAGFFDAVESLKGVQMTTLSLGFKVPNTRGFTNTTNPRFLQMVDGADTQAPGLGVSIANTVGPTELDIESVEVVPGASSALYGLNALNGISNLLTKSPFTHQGLSFYQKTGVNHVNDSIFSARAFTETAIRYAKAFNNRFAFKINAGFMRGTDWVANNQQDQNSTANVSTGLLGADNPAKDPINSYGNESTYRKTVTMADGKSYSVARTGYAEKDLVNHNYGVSNPKLDLALHYRTANKTEFIYSYRLGQSQSIYQRGNRIRLDGYTIQQHKAEVKGAHYFVRSYATLENTTNSYNLGPQAGALDKAFKSDNTWYADYQSSYNASYLAGASAAASHRIARQFADQGRFQPGTDAFNAEAAKLIHVNNWDKGSQLVLQNKLVHAEGQYDFSGLIKWVDILAGADARDFIIKPDGNSFINPNKDDPYGLINYTRFGGFVQGSKKFLDNNLKIIASVRVDKNKYFSPKVNPRIAAVYTLNENHNFRVSIQNGYRFPTLFEGFSAVNNAGEIRYGGIEILTKDLRIFENSYVRTTVDAFQKAILNDVNKKGKSTDQAILDNQNLLVQNYYTYLQPEEITAFDAGYKGSFIQHKLYVDIDAYYNIYNHFIDQIELSVPKKGQVGQTVNGLDSTIFQMNDKSKYTTYRMWTNAQSTYYNYGTSVGVSYNFLKKYVVSGNASFSRLQKESARDAGLQTPFNTPRYITNLSFSNREVVKNVGFTVSWRWQDSFVWMSQLANGTVPHYQTIDAQLTYRFPKIFSTVKLGGTNIFNTSYYQYVGGPSMGAFYYAAITVDGLFRN
jgi:iron complex outermembrane recepter protein